MCHVQLRDASSILLDPTTCLTGSLRRKMPRRLLRTMLGEWSPQLVKRIQEAESAIQLPLCGGPAETIPATIHKASTTPGPSPRALVRLRPWRSSGVQPFPAPRRHSFTVSPSGQFHDHIRRCHDGGPSKAKLDFHEIRQQSRPHNYQPSLIIVSHCWLIFLKPGFSLLLVNWLPIFNIRQPGSAGVTALLSPNPILTRCRFEALNRVPCPQQVEPSLAPSSA